MSYNILLGCPCIHANMLVPLTLHQCIKYCDEYGEVYTLVADKQPFKGMENYFMNAMLYELCGSWLAKISFSAGIGVAPADNSFVPSTRVAILRKSSFVLS